MLSPVKFAIAIGTLLYGHVVGKKSERGGKGMKKKGFASGVEEGWSKLPSLGKVGTYPALRTGLE
jgi:hypothetical protein